MKRFHISTTTRLSFGLVALTLSVISAAQVIGLIPDPNKPIIEGRLKLSETVGVHCAAAMRNGVDMDSLRATVSALVSRNDDVFSAGIRIDQDQTLLLSVGDHPLHWQGADPERSTPTHVRVPIIKGGKRWGAIEISFKPLYGRGVLEWMRHNVLGTMLFVGISGFFAYMFYLRRTLKQLNPRSVIPERIQAMLNTLTEGVVVLDKHAQIVLANEVFATYTGKTSEELQGMKMSKLKWELVDTESDERQHPWTPTVENGTVVVGTPLRYVAPGMEGRTFVVNSAPVMGGDGSARGALVTFGDVTAIEKKNVQLNDMISMLKTSRDQISKQNEELHRLATRDALTGCLNRRSLFEQIDVLWNMAVKGDKDIGCIMLDIDKFKSVNDTHGHAKGDDVLREVSGVLLEIADEMHLVCRYGGEEFSIFLPRCGVEEAAEVAEQFRAAIEEKHCGGLDITSSFGVSAKSLGAGSPQEMLDQADKALYAAKRGGRNRVVKWSHMPEEAATEEQDTPEDEPQDAEQDSLFIPFQAVSGLLAALSHRDAATGQHSRRVADLCTMVAKDLMSPRDCFVLEAAALLHDVGKLGIPESILQKPGPLTEEERQVMQLHDAIGIEIVEATFASKELTRIIATHHAWYGGREGRSDLPSGTDIPYMARILTIADAFDAMVSDRPYRTPRSLEDAFDELRRCTGTQFDPDLVEQFIQVVSVRIDAGYDYRDSKLGGSNPMLPQLAWGLDQAIEQLSQACKDQDFASLPLLAGQLKMAAGHMGLGKIVELAQQVEQATVLNDELQDISQLVGQLLDLCESSQPEQKAEQDHPLQNHPGSHPGSHPRSQEQGYPPADTAAPSGSD